MTIEALQALCLRLPGTTEALKWGMHLCFSVGGKLHLGTSPDALPPTASFIAPPEELETLGRPALSLPPLRIFPNPNHYLPCTFAPASSTTLIPLRTCKCCISCSTMCR